MAGSVTTEAPVSEAPAVIAGATAVKNAEEATPVSKETPGKTTETRSDEDFAVNAGDSTGIKARIEKAARRARAAEAQVAQFIEEKKSVDAFWSWAEEKGLTKEKIESLLEGRAEPKAEKPVSEPEKPSQKADPTGADRRNELAKEFDANSYDDLSGWEKRTVDSWIKQELSETQREAESKTAQQTTKQRQMQKTLDDIARDVTETLADEEFKGIKTDPKAVYDYMVEFSIVDPKVAALAVYKADLKKHWQSEAEKLVLSRKDKAPVTLETTTANQPSENYASDDLVKDVVESLKAGGKIDRSLFNT